MAARPAAAAALKRASAFPAAFFTSPAARRTNFISPRYFTQAFMPLKQRPMSPLTSVLSGFRTSKPVPTSSAPFSTSARSYHTYSTRPCFTTTTTMIMTTTRRQFSSSSVSSSNGGSLTVGQRMRQLFKEYGMSAVGVYFLLSVLDFPLCFLFVKMVGTEKIAHYEHIIIDGFWSIMPAAIQQFRPKAIKEAKVEAEKLEVGIGGDLDSLARGEGLKDQDASKNGKGDSASLWTVLILAYAVHKSLIFFRVPLTAAVTPKIVQKLRGWGFNIGKKGGVRQGVKDARANLKDMKERRTKKKGRDDDDD